MNLELAYMYRLFKLKKEKHSDLSVLPAWINKNLSNVAIIYDDIVKNRYVDVDKKLDYYF
jgi:hypothetical protein